VGIGQRIAGLDAAAESWMAARRSGPTDAVAHLVASAADRSKLWVGIAAVRAAGDQRTGYRAALRAIAVVGLESAAIHAVVKRLFRRDRPVTQVDLRFGARRPPSSSFPSGHAASAATAAVLLADGMPGWGMPLSVLALGVGWSRVQTGLHHTSDVAGGLAIGAALGWGVKRVLPLDCWGAHD
jgi:membrane-associated phospholipid phosphatase